MNVDFALKRLGSCSPGEKVLFGGERALPLHSMVASCGWQKRVQGSSYDWNGLKRGKAEFCLVQYTLRGRGMLEYEGARSEVLPGTAMLLYFPHWNRYWLPEGEEPWEFLYVCLNGRELVKLWRELVAALGPLVELDGKGEEARRIAGIYKDAMAGALDNPFESSAQAYALAMAFAKKAFARSGESKAPKRHDAVKRALRCCQERLADSALDVEAIAAAAGLSRHHFSRLFERQMGESPAAYLKGQRLKEAARLLQTGDLSVKEAATACGFGDCSYFCRAFREAFGAPPGSFKRSGIFGAG